jgi:hypothetical protein
VRVAAAKCLVEFLPKMDKKLVAVRNEVCVHSCWFAVVWLIRVLLEGGKETHVRREGCKGYRVRTFPTVPTWYGWK